MCQCHVLAVTCTWLLGGVQRLAFLEETEVVDGAEVVSCSRVLCLTLPRCMWGVLGVVVGVSVGVHSSSSSGNSSTCLYALVVCVCVSWP
jgi:hypothetical protein